MKVCYQDVKKRRENLMLIIQKLGEVDMATLENDFNVSPMTIRRDLQYWEDRGAIVRHYGGVKLVQNMVNTTDGNLSKDNYKNALAKYAASFVEENDTIFINTSSTSLLIIQYIIGKRCTIITNNAKAIFIKHDPLVQIVLTGGELRFPKETMVGDLTISALNTMVANKCFLGCSGLSAADGVSTAIMQEVAVNKTMLQRTAGKKFFICDYTKIGLTHSFISAPISYGDHIITNDNANMEELTLIQEKNPNIIIDKIPPLRNYEY